MTDEVKGLSQTDAARELEISTTWLRVLTDRGVVSRNEDGSYPWPLVADEYAAFREASGSDEPDELELERIRWTRAKADRQEQDNRVRSGDLLEKAERNQTVRETLEAGNRALGSTPRKLAKRWARKLKVKEPVALELIEEVVEDIRKVLREVAGTGGV